MTARSSPTSDRAGWFLFESIARLGRPRPACGERSDRIARCDPGEGESPRVRVRGESPSPQPSPRKRGEGAHFGRRCSIRSPMPRCCNSASDLPDESKCIRGQASMPATPFSTLHGVVFNILVGSRVDLAARAAPDQPNFIMLRLRENSRTSLMTSSCCSGVISANIGSDRIRPWSLAAFGNCSGRCSKRP